MIKVLSGNRGARSGPCTISKLCAVTPHPYTYHPSALLCGNLPSLSLRRGHAPSKRSPQLQGEQTRRRNLGLDAQGIPSFLLCDRRQSGSKAGEWLHITHDVIFPWEQEGENGPSVQGIQVRLGVSELLFIGCG